VAADAAAVVAAGEVRLILVDRERGTDMQPINQAREAELATGGGAGETESRTEPLPYLGDPLWLRLKDFSPDDPASKLPFSQRLARENGWSRHYASRVIKEYKRFCYLAMTAGHSVSPSDEVDQAWHLHLLYTENYWDDFCGRVLGRKFHHGPTRGGADESAKHYDWYEATLASYRRTFGLPPPGDIWPAAEARFAKPQAFRRVDTASYWLVPKPRFRFFRSKIG
jgi:hypothetical protein